MKTCFMCKKTSETEKVMEFDDHSFQKCKHMSLFRQKKNFKHSDILFSEETVIEHGYHSRCYKMFTCLHRKYREEFEDYLQIEKVSRYMESI